MAVRKKRVKRRQVVNSTKKTYDGINFASLLEVRMYKLLKEAGIEFRYEGTSYTTFKPFKLNTECYERARKKSKQMVNRPNVTKVSYTPDFIGKGDKWFIEVKGRANESFSIRWKLFKKLIAETNPTALIFKPMNQADCEQVIEILKKKGYGK